MPENSYTKQESLNLPEIDIDSMILEELRIQDRSAPEISIERKAQDMKEMIQQVFKYVYGEWNFNLI